VAEQPRSDRRAIAFDRVYVEGRCLERHSHLARLDPRRREPGHHGLERGS
jgi:hypothetical protein